MAVSGCQSPIFATVLWTACARSLGLYSWYSLTSRAISRAGFFATLYLYHPRRLLARIWTSFVSFRPSGYGYLREMLVSVLSFLVACGCLVHVSSVHWLPVCSLRCYSPTALIYDIWFRLLASTQQGPWACSRLDSHLDPDSFPPVRAPFHAR